MYPNVLKHLLGELITMDLAMVSSSMTLSHSHDVLWRAEIVEAIDQHDNALPLVLS